MVGKLRLASHMRLFGPLTSGLDIVVYLIVEFFSEVCSSLPQASLEWRVPELLCGPQENNGGKVIPDRAGRDLRHKADMGTQSGPCNLREGHGERPKKERSGLGIGPATQLANCECNGTVPDRYYKCYSSEHMNVPKPTPEQRPSLFNSMKAERSEEATEEKFEELTQLVTEWKPMLIYHSENSSALKNYAKSTLPDIAAIISDSSYDCRQSKLTTFWKKNTVLDAIKNSHDLWEKVKLLTLTEVWKKLISTLVDDFYGFKTSVEEVLSADVVEIAKELKLYMEPENAAT
ncbi:hypothetical protein QTO34_007608 [Cnephaeus nilssonii]|uniref:Uncharacterized protein n=1 Tax=Cnephaeus nilssonii TaxID=3371016 RepID=A0AA40HIR3_CNENI|nr:hypothetical protein QTO34_007608 [Eptesicus nilssonii]